MPPSPDGAEGRARRVYEEYRRRRERGENVDFESLCAAHAELEDTLRALRLSDDGAPSLGTTPADADRRTHHITRLLGELSEGKDGAAEALFARVYDELQVIAWKYLRGERPGHTLEVSDLVHEAWLRLAGDREPPIWKNRRHFFHAAAEAMRRILLDHARRRRRLKRGGGRRRVPLNALEMATSENSGDILAVDEAIRRLDEEDTRLAQMVRLRFLAGLSVDQTAEVLGTSSRTVMRDWRFARAWLHQFLKEPE